MLLAQEGEQRLAPVRVELAHDVVEEQDGIFARLGAQELELGELQRERARALLSLRAEGTQVDAVDGEHEVVPVGADGGRAARDVIFPALLQFLIIPCFERICHRRRRLAAAAVDDEREREVLLAAGDAALHEVREHAELAHDLEPFARHARGARRELRLPGRERGGRRAPLADALQERVPLRDEALIRRELVVVGGARLRDLPVEEAPPLGGRALDEEEILGGEEDGVERADELLLADGLAVEADLPPPAAREEELEAALRRKTRKGQLQRAGLLSEADEIPILMRAVGAPERRVADGL